jgi:hypothetical protein
MVLRKNINLFLVLLMLGAQLAIAQHASLHFTERDYVAYHQENHNEGTPQALEICQLCISAKASSFAVVQDDVIVYNLSVEAYYKAQLTQYYIKQQISHGYLSRAPPFFLI